ncbi:hypothetical protein [uncultured Clostridium sp.]|uniref:hypothetical protein n=1 Tax=uncultured Clostridium sp. TaxID=59620 RepID=UPI00260EFE08|nr:hypothetical protein [uncultured Clostridium sp.]
MTKKQLFKRLGKEVYFGKIIRNDNNAVVLKECSKQIIANISNDGVMFYEFNHFKKPESFLSCFKSEKSFDNACNNPKFYRFKEKIKSYFM